VFYKTSRVFKNSIDMNNENILASEIGALYKYYKNNNVISDYYFNVVNDYSIKFLKDIGAKTIGISVECDLEKLKLLNLKHTEVYLYGKPELMIMKYCPLKELINNCRNCKNNPNKYYLEDRLGYKYRIINNNCITYIMHYKNINNIDNLYKYIYMGINNFRIDLLEETKEDIENLLNKVNKYIENKEYV